MRNSKVQNDTEEDETSWEQTGPGCRCWMGCPHGHRSCPGWGEAALPVMAALPLCSCTWQSTIPPSSCHLNNLLTFYIALQVADRNTHQA